MKKIIVFSLLMASFALLDTPRALALVVYYDFEGVQVNSFLSYFLDAFSASYIPADILSRAGAVNTANAHGWTIIKGKLKDKPGRISFETCNGVPGLKASCARLEISNKALFGVNKNEAEIFSSYGWKDPELDFASLWIDAGGINVLSFPGDDFGFEDLNFWVAGPGGYPVASYNFYKYTEEGIRIDEEGNPINEFGVQIDDNGLPLSG